MSAVRTSLWEDLAHRPPPNHTESTRKRFLTCEVDALRGEAALRLPLPSLEGSADHPALPDSPSSSRRLISPLAWRWLMTRINTYVLKMMGLNSSAQHSPEPVRAALLAALSGPGTAPGHLAAGSYSLSPRAAPRAWVAKCCHDTCPRLINRISSTCALGQTCPSTSI